MPLPGVLHFHETYVDRIWGGRRLESIYGKLLPDGVAVGEAWMISDHRSCESVVSEGPLAGRTLRQLLEDDAKAVLGHRAELTIHGRFPLLLKLLDAREVLSVQVHPDDAIARDLGEPDVGKTEMWHVLAVEPASRLICGLTEDAEPSTFAASIADGSVEKTMLQFPVQPGDSVFVAAGVVHAIGAGVLLAEIQQNSDLTYRLYDWGRVDNAGTPRELHVEKGLRATRFGANQGGLANALTVRDGNALRTYLAACRYFAAVGVELDGRTSHETRGDSFHIVLSRAGRLTVSAGSDSRTLSPGECVLIPGAFQSFEVEGQGSYLDYFVPDLACDVLEPLKAAGHSADAIAKLGGPLETSDIAKVVGIIK